MESLHGPINPCITGEAEHLDLESLEKEQGSNAFGYCTSYGPFINTHSLSFEEEEEEEEEEETQHLRTPSLDDNMPFLHMLQSVESPPFTEPSFRVLLRLQHQKMSWDPSQHNYSPPNASRIVAPEQESCLTHSPVRSKTKDPPQPPLVLHSNWGKSESCSSPSLVGAAQTESRLAESPPENNRDRRKRKRTRGGAAKDKKELESQRMTHIAVERNRRRQMNDHLTALRSLMPPSYIRRGDQASVIGGAIDFVKELEQLLESLQAQKRVRNNSPVAMNGMFTSSYSSPENGEREEERNNNNNSNRVELMAEGVGKLQVTVIEKHVNLKIECGRSRPGQSQLVRAIVALENLRLTVLHLNITSLETSVHYSFSLKIEDECKVGSANEIAGAVQQIFSFINGC